LRRGAFVGFCALLILLHFFLHIGLGLGGWAPDFVVVVALLAARRTSATGGALLAVLLGLLDDAPGIHNLGGRSVALAVAAVLGTWSRGLVEGEGLLFILVYLFLGKWAAEVVLALLPGTHALPLGLLVWAPAQAAITAVAGTLAFTAFRVVAGPDA
jgi:hypothetical protein